MLAVEPSDQGFLRGDNVVGNEVAELELKNCDPFQESADVMVNYTWDAQGHEFHSGRYSRYFEADNQILGNYQAWVRHFEKIEHGHCVVTQGLSDERSEGKSLFIFHSIIPTFSQLNSESLEILQIGVANCLETANTLGAESIALPLLGCDTEYDYPTRQAISVILKMIKVWMDLKE